MTSPNANNSKPNILGQLLNFGTVFVANIKWIAALAVIGVFMFGIATCHSETSWTKKYNAYRDSTTVVLARADSESNIAKKLKAHADSSDAANKILGARNRTLRNQNDSLVATSDSLGNQLDSLMRTSNFNPTIALNLCVKERENLNEQIANLNSRITNFETMLHNDTNTITDLRAANITLTVSNTDLSAQLRKLPEPPPPPKLFGLFHLNSNQAFLAGILLTEAAHIITTHQVP